MMENLILIDGNSLLFRAYFAMRPMVTSDGVYTQGIFAFINMLGKILADYEHDYIGVAFDMKEKTFRHEQYAEYKAGRLKTPIELLSEVPLLHEVLNAMNIKVLEMLRYEADDLIGTVAKRASSENIRTLIITGDKDELQLVDENTRVLINKKGMSEFDLYDVQAMYDRYGLTPEQFIDLKGLMGDKSDNIPGVAGIGEKKGIALLKEYGSLENVLDHADEIKGKMGDTLRESKTVAAMSKSLATIYTEAPIEFTWDDLRYREPDTEALIKIYTRLEFNSFIKKLGAETGGKSSDIINRNADLTGSPDDIKETDFSKFISTVPEGSEVFISADSDNSHVDMPDLSMLYVYSPDKELYAETALTPMNAGVILSEFAEKKYKLCGYDIKPLLYSAVRCCDAEYLPHYDIMVAEYLLEPNRSKYEMSKMLLRYCGTAADEEITRKVYLYYVYNIMLRQAESLEAEGLRELFDTCEMPLVLTLARMEAEGIRCDKGILADIGEELSKSAEELQQKVWTEAGCEFNINSPKQLGQVLFEKMGLPYTKSKGKTGYSTAADVLEKLRGSYPVASYVLEYRKVTKLKSTYVDGLTALIGSDGRIRPHFMQTVAATGRLSCTEPNLQNIPIRDDYGRLIRKAFIVIDSDFSFTGSDYSQIELRIMAALSGDEGLIGDFKAGRDIHKATASRVFEIPEDEVTPLDRTKAKAVNFGVIYGMSGFGLSENLNITRGEAQKYISDYFEKHTAVKEYLDKQVKLGEENRAVRTYFGRIRQIPEFSSRKFMERETAKRLAMNTPIQGTAADIIKFAMNSVSAELRKRGLKSALILQIHDELIVEGPDREVDEVRNILDTCMRNAADIGVDLVCDIHTGKTWYELK